MNELRNILDENSDIIILIDNKDKNKIYFRIIYNDKIEYRIYYKKNFLIIENRMIYDNNFDLILKLNINNFENFNQENYKKRIENFIDNIIY